MIGILVGDGLRATLDLDKYEQRTTEPAPHWDALPGGGWDLLAEIQLDAYGGEVSTGEPFPLTQQKTRGGAGPGRWWVRGTDKWPGFLGGGSAAVGNTGGLPFHKDRIFP